MNRFVQLAVLIIAFAQTACEPVQNADAKTPPALCLSCIAPDTQVVNGLKLYIYKLPDECVPELTQKRPSRTDKTISLCVAAAFTRLDNGSVDGLFAVNGRVSGTVSKRLGGGCLLYPGKPMVKMFGTRDGTLLTQGWIDSTIVKTKASFFQQLQLVRDTQALRYGKDVSLFQRRAFVEFNDSLAFPAVVESESAVTLQQFADALAAMKIRNAIYLDMGGWDEGWIRTTDGKQKTIGLIRSQTARQCNWLVFKKSE
jgi:hypothetical protein